MRRVLLAVLALLILLAGAAAGYVLYKKHQSRNIHGSSTVEFVTTEAAPPKPKRPGIAWPLYGYDEERQRAPAFDLRPPFRRVWTFGARNLVEFPPVVAYNRLYFTNNSGTLFAVNTRTGKRAWRYRSHRCVAATPAVHGDRVFQAFLNFFPCNSSLSPERLEGEVVAFNVGFGRIEWRKKMGPTESSPLVADGLVYVGDWRGKVYALDEQTGEPRWTFTAGGRVKDAMALSGNRLYFGAYDGHVYALNARTGRLIWRASAQARLGSTGTFYSTPAVAYGRVYIGSTDGKMYSYGASSGKLRWSHGTGGYVYSSPAIWRRRVFAGSYSGDFYAFDAATGDVLWKFRANGPISGSPTVIAGFVYFATLNRRTYALDARSGRQVWTFPDGKYTPVVSDGKRLFLVGYAKVYGLVER